MTAGNSTYHAGHFIMYIIVESQCCTSKTNIILFNSYTLKKRDYSSVPDVITSAFKGKKNYLAGGRQKSKILKYEDFKYSCC